MAKEKDQGSQESLQGKGFEFSPEERRVPARSLGSSLPLEGTDALNQLREILVGTAVRDLERRVARAEAHMLARANELEQEGRRRMEVIESHLKKESEALTARLEREHAQMSEAIRSATREHREAIAGAEQRASKLEESQVRIQRDLREEMLQQAKRFLDELLQLRREFNETLERAEAERLWRKAAPDSLLSDFWTEIGTGEEEVHLVAAALRVDSQNLLVISRNEQLFARRELVLQRARELQFAHRQLTREVELKDILVHSIVHDLASPLHGVLGALTLRPRCRSTTRQPAGPSSRFRPPSARSRWWPRSSMSSRAIAAPSSRPPIRPPRAIWPRRSATSSRKRSRQRG